MKGGGGGKGKIWQAERKAGDRAKAKEGKADKILKACLRERRAEIFLRLCARNTAKKGKD